jgi:hypothetical protein
MSENQPIYLERGARQKHMAVCDVCKKNFLTAFSYQKYCKNPCTHKHKFPITKKQRKAAVKQTHKQARQKVLEKAEADRQQTLSNRKWLTMKL